MVYFTYTKYLHVNNSRWVHKIYYLLFEKYFEVQSAKYIKYFSQNIFIFHKIIAVGYTKYIIYCLKKQNIPNIFLKIITQNIYFALHQYFSQNIFFSQNIINKIYLFFTKYIYAYTQKYLLCHGIFLR